MRICDKCGQAAIGASMKLIDITVDLCNDHQAELSKAALPIKEAYVKAYLALEDTLYPDYKKRRAQECGDDVDEDGEEGKGSE